MRFPFKAGLEELATFESFKLKDAGASVQVIGWTLEAMGKGKHHTILIRALGVPDTMKHYHALSEIGSFQGVVVEVDMEILRSHDIVRIKVGVKDPTKFPFVSEATAPVLLQYDIHFQVESVVEIGLSHGNGANKQFGLLVKPTEKDDFNSDNRSAMKIRNSQSTLVFNE